MKCIRKDVVLENDSMQSLILEKEILYNIDHPFIVSMDYVFQNDSRIFFLMDFIEGGELFRHLVKIRRFPEEQAQFMIAQVIIALGHLHEKEIIYRDLKPENVLFNKDGYLLLADFGLATKLNKNKLAKSFCGTAEYLAPEMLKSEGHDQTVDIWTIGILLYEMLVGIPPFFHKNKHQMFYLIQEASVTFPDPVKHKISVSAKAQDLINKLLAKNKKNRLGATGGWKEILAHPFFEGLDVEKLLKKQLKPKYMPDINEGEFKYFDQRLVKNDELAMSVIPKEQMNIIKKKKDLFNNF
jgi:serum/glucocorticoid-regulated kinase 2